MAHDRAGDTGATTTTPRHFTFVVPPAPGHVNPTLGLVEELVERGHRVTYATGPDLLDRATAAGAKPLELPTRLPDSGPNTSFGPEDVAELLDWVLSDAKETGPVLEEALRNDPPDAVLADMMTYTGRLITERLGLPLVATVPNFCSNEEFSLRDEFMPAGFDYENPVLKAAEARLAEYARDNGVDTTIEPFSSTPPPLNLVFVPRRFQLAEETFDERFRFLGPLLRRTEPQSWTPPSADARVLYVSLGTAFNDRPEFYRMCLEAFADSPWHVVMSVGHRVDVEALGEVPANVEIHQHVPQLVVLRHAEVFVSHCGMGSTLESLHAGVPLVGVPQMPEQAANATRAEQLGCGRALDTSAVTAEELRRVVEEVAVDESVRAALAEMRDHVRACGGAAEGADALERHVS